MLITHHANGTSPNTFVSNICKRHILTTTPSICSDNDCFVAWCPTMHTYCHLLLLRQILYKVSKFLELIHQSIIHKHDLLPNYFVTHHFSINKVELCHIPICLDNPKLIICFHQTIVWKYQRLLVNKTDPLTNTSVKNQRYLVKVKALCMGRVDKCIS